MDQEIKSAVNDIMQACKSLNSMIFPQDETGTKLANEVIADLCRYIVHLTLADGVMTGDELQAINYYFDTITNDAESPLIKAIKEIFKPKKILLISFQNYW